MKKEVYEKKQQKSKSKSKKNHREGLPNRKKDGAFDTSKTEKEREMIFLSLLSLELKTCTTW